jgi:hypothetical protein
MIRHIKGRMELQSTRIVAIFRWAMLGLSLQGKIAADSICENLATLL